MLGLLVIPVLELAHSLALSLLWKNTHTIKYAVLCFFGHTQGTQKFLGQGSNPGHSSDPSRCSGNWLLNPPSLRGVPRLNHLQAYSSVALYPLTLLGTISTFCLHLSPRPKLSLCPLTLTPPRPESPLLRVLSRWLCPWTRLMRCLSFCVCL